MAGFRVFSSHIPEKGELLLDPDESHHLVRVRRARVGDPVEVISGAGQRAQALLLTAAGRQARLEIQNLSTEPPAPWKLTLAQALPKGKTMDAVIQRVTELGVDRIQPLFSSHSEVDLDARRAGLKVEKWQQTAIESAKQCGNPWVPDISAPLELDSFLSELPDGCLRMVAALTPDAAPLRNCLIPALFNIREIVILIGPEGDFSPTEYAAIASSGFQAVSLGPRVLRVETAACAFAALVLEELRIAARANKGPPSL